MGAKMSVLRLIISFPLYLSSAMVRFPLKKKKNNFHWKNFQAMACLVSRPVIYPLREILSDIAGWQCIALCILYCALCIVQCIVHFRTVQGYKMAVIVSSSSSSSSSWWSTMRMGCSRGPIRPRHAFGEGPRKGTRLYKVTRLPRLYN